MTWEDRLGMSSNRPGARGRMPRIRRIGGSLRRRLRGQTPPRAPSAPVLADREVPIFFVVGRAKSGTSWLMSLLDSHPAILCRGEGRFFGTQHRLGDPRARSLERALLGSADLREWAARSAWTRAADYEQSARAWSAALVRAIMGGALVQSGKRVVGDKTPLNGPGVVAGIGAMLPEARVIHIIRDGRDVAVSSVHHRWNDLASRANLTPEQLDVLKVCGEYRAGPERFLAAGRSIFGLVGPRVQAETWRTQTMAAREEGAELGSDRYIEVRYEDLLTSGPETLSRLCRFLGVDVDAEQIESCIERNRFDRLTEGRPAGVEDSAAFLRSGRAGDWRHVFTPNDKAVFKQVGGHLLVSLGYEADEAW